MLRLSFACNHPILDPLTASCPPCSHDSTLCLSPSVFSQQGEVYTWGTNDYGQLGNGNTSYQTVPSLVMDLDLLQVGFQLQDFLDEGL